MGWPLQSLARGQVTPYHVFLIAHQTPGCSVGVCASVSTKRGYAINQ
jgi:hypothetical protein